MTIGVAIETVDRLKPNHYTDEEKIKWLSLIDGQIKKEVINTHEKGENIVFTPYTTKTRYDTQLLADDTYSDLYIKFLMAQIDFANNELDRFNNSSVMFNVSYMNYVNYYNRTHMPIQKKIILE